MPQDLLAALKVGVQDLARGVRLLAGIAFFQEKRLSLGKAAQLAGVNRLEFMEALASKGIVVFDYDESELASELKGVTALRGFGV
ncbi:MAG: UPF0175 family protein [Thermoanaerobaculia bacterium]|nr:UPF0175 family protein [Thermoanaerobaculia bacterium]